MPTRIIAKIDVTKVLKQHLFEGKKGKYLELVLTERKDDYGNDWMIAQGVSKEARLAGERGPILGNAKTYPDRAQQAPAQQPQEPMSNEECPF